MFNFRKIKNLKEENEVLKRCVSKRDIFLCTKCNVKTYQPVYIAQKINQSDKRHLVAKCPNCGSMYLRTLWTYSRGGE